jgi:hypothetical protein
MGKKIFTINNELIDHGVGDDLVQREKRCFTISEFYVNFHKFQALFSTRLSGRLGYHNFCARRVSKMLTGAHKTQRITSALTFLSDTIKMAMNFVSHIV